MSNCKYCGKPTDSLKSYHQECEAKCIEGKSLISSISFQTVTGLSNVEALRLKTKKLSQDYLVPPEEERKLLIECWEKSVDHFLEDGVLTHEEEKLLIGFSNAYQLTREDLDRRGFLTKLIKSTVLREVSEGIIKERVRVEGVNLNLQTGEKIIWLFNDTDYYELRVHRQYSGRLAGIGFRIAMGRYLSAGLYRGHPVDTAAMTFVANGNFVVTNKNLYFGGGSRYLRIPFTNIVSFTPFEDGVGIQMDGANVRPQFFVTHDGWFTNNLISSISRGFPN